MLQLLDCQHTVSQSSEIVNFCFSTFEKFRNKLKHLPRRSGAIYSQYENEFHERWILKFPVRYFNKWSIVGQPVSRLITGRSLGHAHIVEGVLVPEICALPATPTLQRNPHTRMQYAYTNTTTLQYIQTHALNYTHTDTLTLMYVCMYVVIVNVIYIPRNGNDLHFAVHVWQG